MITSSLLRVLQEITLEVRLEPSPIEIVYAPHANRGSGLRRAGKSLERFDLLDLETGRNELRELLDNLPHMKGEPIRNSHKIRGLVFWQNNCLQGMW